MVDFLMIKQAAARITPYIRKTDLILFDALTDVTNCELYLKLECNQISNAFKIRGAANKVLSLTEEEKNTGVATASSGNHGAALACICEQLGVKNCHVYVSEATPAEKLENIRKHGAHVIVEGKDYDGAHAAALKACSEQGYVWVDACSDPYVIAGQGTIGLEIHEKIRGLDCVLVPIGGGSIITGVSLALKHYNPGIQIYGVQTAACPAMVASLRDNICYEDYPSEESYCEALVGGVGEIGFKMAKQCIDDIFVVEERMIREAFVFLNDKGIQAEYSSAIVIAAIQKNPWFFNDKKVAGVITGGNLNHKLLAAFRKECGVT